MLDLVRRSQSGLRVLDTGAVVPSRLRPATSPDARWVASGEWPPTDAVRFVSTSGGRRRTVRTGACEVEEPALGSWADRALLAYVGRPCDGGKTRLYVSDVTEALAP